MNEENKERLLNLLADQAIFGLSEEESIELENLRKEFPEFKSDNSFELAAAAINLSNLQIEESLPVNLQSKILADADNFFALSKTPVAEDYQKTFAFEPKRSVWSWLGWAVAGLACIALAINLWTTRFQPNEIVKQPETTITPPPQLSRAQEREQLLASGDVIQTAWTNPKQPKEVLGDIVWSNSQQKGFLRFRGLPANDPNRESYQLWIIDKTQKNPIDGGVFDVTASDEVIIPIDAKLKVKEPAQFAVTAEKPGGVPVSDLGKVMAIAKV